MANIEICLTAEVVTHRAVATWSRRPTLSRRPEPSRPGRGTQEHRDPIAGGSSGTLLPEIVPKHEMGKPQGEGSMLNMQ
ncbi:hypothetical protein Taro_001307 [Colocasia esculenta]|uniref:Uncharacterized protein n=1 Tax=Colocasia esculenta TaxID=4460 RepID=A0A843TIN4_COLES|nr:hypothetical protein [Colocasia esculenta]